MVLAERYWRNCLVKLSWGNGVGGSVLEELYWWNCIGGIVLVKLYRVIQKECKIVHAYFLGLRCNFGAKTGGRILLKSEHFENIFIIEEYWFRQFGQLQRVNFGNTLKIARLRLFKCNTLNSVVYSVHCILCIVFYALYSIHCIICTV